MAPIIKDSAESNNTNRPGASPQSTENKSSQSARSNPVCLEVGVTIRSLPGEAGGPAQPIREEGRTVIVFDNGAVLRSSSNLPAGHKVILSNHHGRDVVCRVSTGRNLPSVKGYVEVEFLEPVGDFWGIHQTPSPVVPATPLSASPARRDIPPPAPPVIPVTPRATSPVESPSKPSNVALGKGPTFEDIPGLISVPTPVATRDSRAHPSKPIPEKAPKETPGYSYSEIADPNSLANWDAPSAGLPADVDKIPLTGEPAASNSGAASRAQTPTHDFLSSGLMAYEKPESASGDSVGRGPLLLGMAALVLAGVAAVVFFMHRSAAPAPMAKAAINQTTPTSKPAPPAANPAPQAAEQLPLDAAVQSAGEAAAQGQAPAQPAVSEQSQPAPAITSVPAVVTNSVSAEARPESRMDSRNARRQNAIASNQPDLSAARRPAMPNLKIAAPSAPNQNLANSSDNAAPADIASNETVGAAPAGLLTSAGRTSAPPAPPPSALPSVNSAPAASASTPAVNTSREAKLLASVRPVYPAEAKETNVQGTVTISANVDSTGKVTGARALTGPILLRQAAVNAVKQWKYSPALVNGSPAASLVVVSLEFKLN